MVLENLDVAVTFHLADQCPFDLMSGNILVVQDTVFAVASFTSQLITSRTLLVKLDAISDQLLDH